MSSKKTSRILCVGEAMAELMLGSNEDSMPELGFAGDTMNTAIYLKRLMADRAEVVYKTVVGHDPLSARLIGLLERESINTSQIRRSEERLLGLYAITTDQAGERTFSYWRSQSAARTLFQIESGMDFQDLASADVIYFSAITLAILPSDVRMALLDELARRRKTDQVVIVFDSNYRPALWESQAEAQRVVSAAWRITDIALPSIDDEQSLFGEADQTAVVNRLRSYGVRRGALKRGASGPLSLNESLPQAETELDLSNELPVEVVDTTAAGDSFNAGYLSAVLDGGDDQAALRAGHACSVRVIGHSGGIIPLDKWF